LYNQTLKNVLKLEDILNISSKKYNSFYLYYIYSNQVL